ncbi:MAG: phosphoribosylaminoimidazolesuccinocarboxamide synthase [Candidatus Aenigmarchaeota archaeon]|nr:phosphoribosylaminoimidazolesuccinocarboxamide synthase [Candidatus Aenigmarchaeota archaeon]
MVADEVLRNQISNSLRETNFRFGSRYRGKVRDNYTVGGERVIVATDRISAFDVVLTTLPFKGQVLNQLAAFWFDKTRHLFPNHVIDVIDPNVTVAKECVPIAVEMVVRGYLTGVTPTSAWYHYQKGVRNFCGNLLPDGMRKDQRFDEPILTPSTKAHLGHDVSLAKEELLRTGVVDRDTFDIMEEASYRLFDFGSRFAEKNGLVLVDTKYEFGVHDGEVVLIDEIHTPDSSRYWFSSSYEENFEKGIDQKSFDKEYLRKWLSTQGFDGRGPVPQIPDEVKVETVKRYVEAFAAITGEEFKPAPGNVLERIQHVLAEKGYL